MQKLAVELAGQGHKELAQDLAVIVVRKAAEMVTDILAEHERLKEAECPAITE